MDSSHYSSRVPALPNMNSQVNSPACSQGYSPAYSQGYSSWESDCSRSVSPEVSPALGNLPIRKRYIRSLESGYHQDGAADQSHLHGGFGGFQSTFSSSSPSSGYSSSSPYSGYSSSEESSGPLDYSKPRNVVRAGVIRHSSNPKLCLAYYYLPK